MKNKLGRSVFILAFCIALIIIFSISFFSSQKKAYNADPSGLLKEFAVQTTYFTIDPREETTLAYSTGSRIHVPPNAFVDKSGTLIEDEVVITYREMHDQIDFLTFGIPFEYDSAGSKFILESAGMIEIRAYTGEEEVYLNTDAELRIQMISKYDETNYNMYYFNEDEENWEYSGPNDIGSLEPEPIIEFVETVHYNIKSEEELEMEIASKLSVPEEPKKPETADEGKYHFSIDNPEGDYTELRTFTNITWEISDKNEAFDPSSFFTTWYDIRINKINDADYEITLVNASETQKYICYPVLVGNASDEELQKFEEQYEQYKQELIARKDEIEQRVKQNLALQAEWEAELYKQAFKKAKVEEEQLKRWEEQNLILQQATAVSAVVSRSFSVDRMGVWNCDRPLPFPSNTPIKVRLLTSTGEPLYFPIVFQMQKGRNNVASYSSSGDFYLIGVSKLKPNLIFAVNMEGELMICRPDKFINLQDNSVQDLVMEKYPGEIKTDEELVNALAFN
ncbi:MAG: hypothetical protein IIA45_15215 [Bacteroidetes bacterium]|nr:hypothetical protein [Bacteroidota bacterium]